MTVTGPVGGDDVGAPSGAESAAVDLGADHLGELAIKAVATELLLLCHERGLTLSVAESLTGGLVCGALTAVPGASAVVRGAVVAYASDRKAGVLGVSAELLESRGAVDPEVALAMARGVRTVMVTEVGLATTGVAGPEPQDGKPVGRVYVAVCGPALERVLELDLEGERDEVRERSVRAVLTLARDVLRP